MCELQQNLSVPTLQLAENVCVQIILEDNWTIPVTHGHLIFIYERHSDDLCPAAEHTVLYFQLKCAHKM